MFIGHFGVGIGAKLLAPRVSLGTLFLAAQFIDLLWPTLLLLGVEQVRIVQGATAVTPLIFERYPVSHSLVAVIGWAALLGGAYFASHRDPRAAWVIAGLVISHWLLDAVVHQPDLPVIPGMSWFVGLGAWSSLPITLLIEIPIFFTGVWIYFRHTSPSNAAGKWGVVGLVIFLLAIYVGNLFGGPPPSQEAIAWAGQLQWLLVAWGYWVDKHRTTRAERR